MSDILGGLIFDIIKLMFPIIDFLLELPAVTWKFAREEFSPSKVVIKTAWHEFSAWALIVKNSMESGPG